MEYVIVGYTVLEWLVVIGVSIIVPPIVFGIVLLINRLF